MGNSLELYDVSHKLLRREICCSIRHRVTFHHPAYKSTRLFELPAFDSTDGGIHHGTALLLCGIIAGGAWNGWLSESNDGVPISADFDAVLSKSNYFFHVPYPPGEFNSSSQPYKWPVILSLEDLTFPHERPPPGWTFDISEMSSSFYSDASASNISQAVRDRDLTCCVTRWADGIERAHLCPRSATEWFTREELERYNVSTALSGATSIDDTANAIALRKDVHWALDNGTFIFTRKRDKWVPHFLRPTQNLGPEYHNTIVEMPKGVNQAFIFANVAIAILPRISNFLVRGEVRRVTLKRESDTPQIIEMSGIEIRQMLDKSKRQRSKSPRKRSREQDQDDETHDALNKRCRYSNSSSSDTYKSALTPVFTESKSLPSASELHSVVLDTNIERLRRQELYRQRNLNREIACCDYNAAEAAIKDGSEGQGKFGGDHVCLSCLGYDS